MKNYILILLLILTGCGSVQLSTINHKPTKFVVLEVPNTVKIDTLSFSRLNWKMRTDFRFRWDYAQFAMKQPYSFYTSSFVYRFWKPLSPIDAYWNRSQFWYEWALTYNNWGAYQWYTPWQYNSYKIWRQRAIMKERRGTPNVDVIANRLRKKVDNREERIYRNPNNVSRNWNNNTRVEPKENPNRFESKITPRQDINNYNNNKSGRDIVNSTKVIMKKGGN
tara:strand:- start:183 stop:848 length:666 start_codon:yes stop_codon:yes gene_type:complete